MTIDKDLKRLVRARMTKTGESYTTARGQVLKKKIKPAPKPEPDLATLAGMSDSAVRAKTGRSWGGWVRALDRVGAAAMKHKDIATLLRDEFETRISKDPSWQKQGQNLAKR